MSKPLGFLARPSGKKMPYQMAIIKFYTARMSNAVRAITPVGTFPAVTANLVSKKFQ
jgi:hypothetical protein